MAQPTEEEIVSKGLNTKEGDIFSLADMTAHFDFNRISLGGPVFDLVKLKWLNGEYLRKLSPEDFFAALRSTTLSDTYLRAIAPLVQARMETLSQFGDMTGFFFSDNVLPAESVWLPKKRTAEETLLFAADQLLTLESAPGTPPPSNPPSKPSAKPNNGRSKKTSCSSAPSSPAAPPARLSPKAS